VVAIQLFYPKEDSINSVRRMRCYAALLEVRPEKARRYTERLLVNMANRLDLYFREHTVPAKSEKEYRSDQHATQSPMASALLVTTIAAESPLNTERLRGATPENPQQLSASRLDGLHRTVRSMLDTGWGAEATAQH
jgi:hypothetical protein